MGEARSPTRATNVANYDKRANVAKAEYFNRVILSSANYGTSRASLRERPLASACRRYLRRFICAASDCAA